MTAEDRLVAAVDAIGRPIPQPARPWALAGVATAIAAAFLWLVLAPLSGATNDTDSAACVLYFKAIAGGQHLAAFFPTTPKPLLTFVYGIGWSLTHDWRTLTILTVLAGAGAVGLAARLAARFAGLAGAVAIVVALLAWPDFRVQVAGANSFVWGLALWLLAAVLVTADRPRPWAAGFVLLLAGLTRTETVWLLFAAGLAALYYTNRGRVTREWAQARQVWPLMLGAVSLPLACLHDWLLTGKPLYWLGVPGGYTAMVFPDIHSAPLTIMREEFTHYLPAFPIVLLALLGVAWLAATGRRALPFALSVLFLGVLATLVYLSWRAVYVSPRYYAESDAAVLLAAAIGLGALLVWLFGLAETEPKVAGRPVARPVLAAGAALVLTLGATFVFVPQGSAGTVLTNATKADSAIAAVEPKLGPILAGATGATTTQSGVGYPVVDPRAARLFVPREYLPRFAVDMGVPTTAFGDSYLAFRDGDYSTLSPGQWVLHISSADETDPVYVPFQTETPVILARKGMTSLRLVPQFVDAKAGIWLIRVDAAANA